MAKPTKHAPLICIIMSILAVIGIILSLLLSSPLPAIFLLLPTVVYEVYRTEGASTKSSSIIILVVLILEIVLIIFNIDIDLAGFLGEDTKYIAGYEINLGVLTLVGPTLIAILSIVLFIRTRGVFTRWLAAIVFITAFFIIYELDPESVKELLRFGVDKALDRLTYI